MQSKGIYTSPTEHLLDELKRINLILELCLSKKSKQKANALNELFISQEEIHTLLKQQSPLDTTPENDNQINAIQSEREQIDNRLAHTLSEGYLLPLEHLKSQFSLSPLELDILLLCLSPSIDTKYQKIYAHLQDDATKTDLTIQLLFKLLADELEEQIIVRDILSNRSSLLHWQLIHFKNNDDHSKISKPLSIDERMVDFILGSSELDSQTAESLTSVPVEESIESLHLEDNLKKKMRNLIQYLKGESGMESSHILHFSGPKGSGKKYTASAIAHTLNFPLLEVDIKQLIQNDENDLKTFKRIVREALLTQSLLLIDDFDLLINDPKSAFLKDSILKEVSNSCWITFLTTSKAYNFKNSLGSRWIYLDFPIPGYQLRKKIWEKSLTGNNGHSPSLKSLTPDKLASMFKFTEGQIKGALSLAFDKTLSQAKGYDHFEENLLTGCRSQSNQKLSELSVKVTSPFTWDDIILPEDQLTQLKEIITHLKHKYHVYNEWGFKKKISSGRGLNVLFSGVSGTGKTMSAGIIANELKLELYKIDLSTVVSKYIGETEKNLDKIFKEADTSNAILFFDEADALFGKRSEVKDAHDRYANIEIGYLLQKMEEYEGMTILATNLRQNIDEAFTRRMQFIIEFSFPDEKRRKQIWERIFPNETPLSEDINFDFLSERLKLSGGNIKNMALSSAFYAAEKSTEITMTHIMHSAKREYQKMGKTFLQKDFKPYYNVIKQED